MYRVAVRRDDPKVRSAAGVVCGVCVCEYAEYARVKYSFIIYIYMYGIHLLGYWATKCCSVQKAL